MRRVLVTDLVALARVLLKVPEALREETAERVLHEARAADRFRRLHGRSHSRFGAGTLATAAGAYPMADECFADDPDFCACLVAALRGISVVNGHPVAQEMQRMAVGSSCNRFSAITSPQSSQ